MVPGVRALIRPRFLVAAAVAGVAAGLIGIAMALLLELFESLFYGLTHGGLLERLAASPPWRRVLAPALGGLVAGGLWWWLRATGGVADVENAVADRSGEKAPRMGLARPFLDAVTQVLTVGAGNSVGREGAPRLASAAGAGLAAMYNAPMGGAAYAVELVMVSGMRRRGALVAVPVCLIATIVSWLHSHGRPTFEVASPGLSAATARGLVLLVPVAAALGVGARALWSWMLARRVRTLRWLPAAIGAAGLVTGLVSLWVPAVVGNGRDAMEVALGTRVPEVSSDAAGAGVVLLLGVVVLKPVLTGLTLAAGATGGRLAPSLATGASAGTALAVVLHAYGVEVSVPALAMAGAGAVLATTQRAPVFGIVFTWELARAGAWTLVALLAVVLAATLLASPPGGLLRSRSRGSRGRGR